VGVRVSHYSSSGSSSSGATSTGITIVLVNDNPVEYYNTSAKTLYHVCPASTESSNISIQCSHSQHSVSCPAGSGGVLNFTCPEVSKQPQCKTWDGTAFKENPHCIVMAYNEYNTTCFCSDVDPAAVASRRLATTVDESGLTEFSASSAVTEGKSSSSFPAVSPTASPAASSGSSNSDGLSSGPLAGIVVGASVGAVLVVVLWWWLLRGKHSPFKGNRGRQDQKVHATDGDSRADADAAAHGVTHFGQVWVSDIPGAGGAGDVIGVESARGHLDAEGTEAN
jgi:hypothetical protein